MVFAFFEMFQFVETGAQSGKNTFGCRSVQTREQISVDKRSSHVKWSQWNHCRWDLTSCFRTQNKTPLMHVFVIYMSVTLCVTWHIIDSVNLMNS